MEAASEITGGRLQNYTEGPSVCQSNSAMSTPAPPPDPPERPKRADARRNYEKVLAAAREAFAEGGESTALEEIARRAGVGIGTLYRHFPNRQALLEALYVGEVEEICRSAAELERRGPVGGARAAGSSASSATSPRSRRSPTSCSTTWTATRELFKVVPRVAAGRPASRCSGAPRRRASCAPDVTHRRRDRRWSWGSRRSPPAIRRRPSRSCGSPRRPALPPRGVAQPGPRWYVGEVAEAPDRQELLTALTTEHFTLRGAR